jgi:hypothetical protein
MYWQNFFIYNCRDWQDRPELVEADMVGQANNIFWLMMNELQDGG